MLIEVEKLNVRRLFFTRLFLSALRRRLARGVRDAGGSILRFWVRRESESGFGVFSLCTFRVVRPEGKVDLNIHNT